MVDQDPYKPPAAEVAQLREALSEGQYEFTGQDNWTIDRVGRRAAIWGVISIIIGVLALLFGVIMLAGVLDFPAPIRDVMSTVIVAIVLPFGIVYLGMGKLYLDSGGALRRVVTTEGNDVELLMRGIDKMASAFRVEVILTVVAMAAGFIAGAVIAAVWS